MALLKDNRDMKLFSTAFCFQTLPCTHMNYQNAASCALCHSFQFLTVLYDTYTIIYYLG